MAMSPAAFPAVPPGTIGSTTVINNCASPVYQHVSGFKNGAGWDGPTQMIPAKGFNMPFDTTVSIKLFHEPDLGHGSISQLEFNLDKKEGRIWYDLSNVDGFCRGKPPFMEGGMSLAPGGATNAACAPIHCAAGVEKCKDAYNAPRDDKTYVCPMSTNLHLVLCPDAPSQSGRPDQGGWGGWMRGGGVGRATFKKAEHLSIEKSLANELEKSNDSKMAGGLTGQRAKGSSSKSSVAKLLVLGMVAGLACYFVTML